MPYEGQWHDLPEDQEDLIERIMAGYAEGHRKGVEDGLKFLREQLGEWLYKRYMSRDVIRKTPEAEALLKIAQEFTATFDTKKLEALKSQLTERQVPRNDPRSTQ